MRSSSKNAVFSSLLVLLAALAASCKVKGERQPYERVGAAAEVLREAFNAGAGKVRLIVLVAPT